jgi:hypothetical protein
VALSPTDKLILIAVLAAAMLFVIFFEMKIMRGKTREIRRASQRKDEAFNAILTTRTVINVMDRQGASTGTAQNLVRNAKDAMERGDYDRCVELCDKARSELVMPSRRKAEPSEPAAEVADERERFEEVAEQIVSSDKSVGTGDAYRGTKLSVDQDGNYLSARFEMNTAKADIARAVQRGSDTSEAQDLMTQAESAFVGGSYTKALSLAVRARKSANAEAESETIPLRQGEVVEEPEAEPTPEEMSSPESARCGSCGAPLDPDDAFCHKCGEKVLRERFCKSCGEKARSSDMFCRKCGARIG